MTLVDSNIWLAMAVAPHVFHEPAVEWFEGRADGPAVFCRATQQSFLRLLTTQAVFVHFEIPPLINRSAWATYHAFRNDNRVGWIDEPEGLEPLWKKLASRGHAAPKLWMDAYLAALAIASGCPLATTDLAFRQFKGLDLVLVGRS